ncbi:gliding motility-associated C-terminal domain-containing protein [Tenuifilum thalassicum]|uniref:Gliding motility-associated C-terminal domain-containing protein n=2 Tax=Tenuifilum thalassicum TaxID=2590900 RepID=A0A7D4BYH9_9BACT|nr:gliding motility-associated C-terminal domain-containing protein [Tenuifilum thalassicum]
MLSLGFSERELILSLTQKLKKMKKITLYLLISLCLASIVRAQDPGWSVNPADYSYTMTITGVFNYNGYEVTNASDKIAAFIDGECRGVSGFELSESNNRYMFYLVVYSNEENKNVTFKYYNSTNNTTYDAERSVTFSINGIVGNLQAPLVLSYPTLSSESKILTFSIENQVGETSINDYEISLQVPRETDLSRLYPEFTTSPLAYVRLHDQYGQAVVSGLTELDFTNDVKFWVMSADETDTSFYNVHVTHYNNVPSKVSLSDSIIDETYKTGSLVGYLSADDQDFEDIHSFELVEGEGDNHNSMFYINGNELRLAKDIYFQTNTFLSIRVKADDGMGGVIEQPLLIVFRLLSAESLRAANIVSPNGDGIFDTWIVQNHQLYSDYDFYIYSSSGELVFKSKGYNTPWDGRRNGTLLPIGAYYYVVKSPEGAAMNGVISLIY